MKLKKLVFKDAKNISVDSTKKLILFEFWLSLYDCTVSMAEDDENSYSILHHGSIVATIDLCTVKQVWNEFGIDVTDEYIHVIKHRIRNIVASTNTVG